MIKMQPAMTEQMKSNHFHSLLRKGALQTFRNINSIYRQTLEDVLVIFRRKYVKPESQATWMASTPFWPGYHEIVGLLGRIEPVGRKSFWWKCKTYDWQLAVCRSASKVEEICQHGPLGERDIRRDCRSSWRRARTQYVRGVRWHANSQYGLSVY